MIPLLIVNTMRHTGSESDVQQKQINSTNSIIASDGNGGRTTTQL